MRGLWVGVSLIDHWIGPILGRVDLGLSDELRTAFAALHRRPRPLAPESIHAVLEADLGAAARELVDSMHLDPLAADPIGQTYGATLADGTPVAVKIRDADIFEEVDRDLTPATLSARLAPWFPASAQLDALAADLHARALDACDYALAAQRQDRLWWLFANHPTIVVPTVHRAWSSPRVLTTTVVGGQALDAWLQSHHPDQSARDRIGEALFDLYLGALFQHGLCKADADPGNYRLLADGRVALVDFGSMR